MKRKFVALIIVLFAVVMGCEKPEKEPEKPQPPTTEQEPEEETPPSEEDEDSKPEPPELVGIVPVLAPDIPDEVTAFFEEYLAFSIDNPYPEFYFGDIDRYEQVCLTVNSVEEFKAVVPSADELPAIDFDKFTLVVGQYYISYSGWIIKEQSVDSEPDVMKLNLVLEDTGKGLDAIFYPPYWNLYQKLPQKAITFNISTIKGY